MTTDVIERVRPRRAPLYRNLSLQILFAMLAGIAVGVLWPASADAVKPLGDVFIRLVRMLVAPIVFCSVVHGIASVGQARRVGRVGFSSLMMFSMVGYVMVVAQGEAVGDIAVTVRKFGPSSIIALGRLVGEFYFCGAFCVRRVLWPVAQWARLNFVRFGRYFAPELL